MSPSQTDTIGAIKLALEFRRLARPDDVLKLIERLVREVPLDKDSTEPTRLLVAAIRIERPR